MNRLPWKTVSYIKHHIGQWKLWQKRKAYSPPNGVVDEPQGEMSGILLRSQENQDVYRMLNLKNINKSGMQEIIIIKHRYQHRNGAMHCSAQNDHENKIKGIHLWCRTTSPITLKAEQTGEKSGELVYLSAGIIPNASPYGPQRTDFPNSSTHGNHCESV